MGSSRARRVLLAPVAAAVLVYLGAYVVAAALHPGARPRWAAEGGLQALQAAGVLGALLALPSRPAGRQRRGWSFITAGMVCFAAGGVLWTALGNPLLSVADPLFLAFPLLTGTGLVILYAEALRAAGPDAWLDGLATALGAGALAVLLVSGPTLTSAATAQGLALAVNAAYPLSALVLAGVLLCAFVAADVFRMGGDEFCVLVTRPLDRPDVVMRTAAAAMSEHGEGFAITASYGVVTMPQEACTPEEALRVADHRMYACKRQGRASAGRQTSDVLLQALAERDGDLGGHNDKVAALCAPVARRVGLSSEAIEEAILAAQLHDVGKVAIPDAVLQKPGPLDPDELAFIRRHTVIGERILQAAPALTNVAKIVRSTHERWDGGGYPDGLAGGAIPLAARIVFVCDAYDAMSSHRPYQAARSHPEILAELEAHAGTQFDPSVVLALREVLDQGTATVRELRAA
jgi:HD-GYP domain-containing protein (c-di-GMP phosphodiesterase class II)